MNPTPHTPQRPALVEEQLKQLRAPQRPGFQAELQRRIQAASEHLSSPTQMKSKSPANFLAYFLAVPAVAVAAFGIFFAVQHPGSTNSPLNPLSPAQVQAAVNTSIEKTFAYIQSDSILHQKFTQHSSSDFLPEEEYSFETWKAGLDKIVISESGNPKVVDYANLLTATSTTLGRNCSYAPGGIEYDGVEGSFTTPTDFDCTSVSSEDAPPFNQTVGTDLGLTTFVTPSTSTDHWIILQWTTAKPVTSNIEVSVLNEKATGDIGYEQLLFELNLKPGPNGIPGQRAIPQEFFNQTSSAGYLQSIYLPDLAYAEKYELNALPGTLYFQISYTDVTSAVYSYAVGSGKITALDPTTVARVTANYQEKTLLQQKGNVSDSNIVTQSQTELRLVKSAGMLGDYSEETVDGKTLLHAEYTLAEDSLIEDSLKAREGTYNFTIDTQSQHITQWSYTNPQGTVDTTTIDVNETLPDDPSVFFTEAHWRKMLAERGVKAE